MDPHGTDTNPPPTTSHPLRMPAALKSRTYGQYLMSEDPARQIRGGGGGGGDVLYTQWEESSSKYFPKRACTL